MAVAPAGEDNYPEPVVTRAASPGALWRVVGLSVVFIAIATGFALLGDAAPTDMVLLFLGILAVIGVFSLFALAAGLFRFVGGEEKRTLARAIVDSLPYGALVTDRDGKIAYANASYAELSRAVTKGVPVGVPRLLAGHPEASEAIYRLSRAARDGRAIVEDIRLPRAGGGAQWLRVGVRNLPEFDGGGRRPIIWTVEDITRDRETQENFYVDLQKVIDYLDHAPAGFFSANARGRIQYINSTLADWLGYDLAAFEAGELDLSEIVHGDGAGLLLGGGQEGTVRTEIVDLDLVRRDGTSLPVRLLHRAARLAEGELGETRTLVLDRSRALDGEEALRAAQVQFSRFFNNTPIAIAALDANGKVVRTNAPFTRIFGLTSGERSIEGIDIGSLVDEEGAGKFRAALNAAKGHKSEIDHVDATVPGEEARSVRMFISGVEQSGESDEAAILYALDMTEQRQLEAQFAQGMKMQAVGQLAGGVAHDFNNVLTAIIGFSELLLLKHRPSDPSFSDIMSIKQSANRAAGLVKQLLAFSRRQTLRPQILEIPQHVDDLTVLLKRLIGERVTLDVEHAADVWPVRADLVQLEQVIINLVVNARDAMPNGGAITLRTRNVLEAEATSFSYRGMPAADYVLIEVEDTGTGMTPEVMEKIFEPFFSTKELGKGTGLGLSMVYGIIKQTGGFIYPESEVGKGTTFRIFLPRHIPAPDEVAAKQVAAPVKDLTGNERILIVEDEESVRAFSARALAVTGYEVFEAASGEEALEVLEEIDGQLDLMISDVVMPEMDGPTLLTEVRKKYPGLKVIFVSGYAEESVRQGLADDRSVEFLPKPYSLDQINSKVKEVLTGRKAGEQGD
ncbi:cell cycle histidine kinase CckA [Pelagibacterium limicola]|uniref:cell cycle histidine kinase CckA n=1 Tax=Pelagibacterium limicola TaxID=2791022 RepID=UPI0018AFBF10|nr:PAS domain-containing sensor histidine kinase [Pelagibacterium limicola]